MAVSSLSNLTGLRMPHPPSNTPPETGGWLNTEKWELGRLFCSSCLQRACPHLVRAVLCLHTPPYTGSKSQGPHWIDKAKKPAVKLADSHIPSTNWYQIHKVLRCESGTLLGPTDPMTGWGEVFSSQSTIRLCCREVRWLPQFLCSGWLLVICWCILVWVVTVYHELCQVLGGQHWKEQGSCPEELLFQ